MEDDEKIADRPLRLQRNLPYGTGGRKELKLSLDRLAERYELSTNYLASIEKGGHDVSITAAHAISPSPRRHGRRAPRWRREGRA